MAVQPIMLSAFSSFAAASFGAHRAAGARPADSSRPTAPSRSGERTSPNSRSSGADRPVREGQIRSADGDLLDLSPQARGTIDKKPSAARTYGKNIKPDSSATDPSAAIGNQENDSPTRSGITREAAGIFTNGTSQVELTAEQLRQVRKLQSTDSEVRSHEAAHLAAAGPYAKGGAQFSYRTGPDGQQYATGGEVSIDITPIQGDPEATIRKAQQVRQAALAPARPSAQDQRVASAAMQMEMKARQELNEQKKEKIQASDSSSQKTAQAADGKSDVAEKHDAADQSSPQREREYSNRLEDWPEFTGGFRPMVNEESAVSQETPAMVAASSATLERESAARPAARESEMNEQVRNPAASGPASPVSRIKTDPAVVATAFQSASTGPMRSRFGAVA
jgi:hypothetical protein